MFEKQKPIRDKKRLQNAKHCNVCMNCGSHAETIVAAHYQGFRQHAFGKGTSQKPDDLATAYLCQLCHDEFDGRIKTEIDDMEKSEAFLYAIVKTNIWIARNAGL